MNTHPWGRVPRSFFVSVGATSLSIGCVLIASTACKSRSFNKTTDASGVREASLDAAGKTDVFDKPVENWGAFPDEAGLEALLSPGSSYVNYSTSASKTPEVDLPGKVVVAGMKALFDKYKTEYVGNAAKGSLYAELKLDSDSDSKSYLEYIRTCMSTGVGNRHYSDLQLGYYCLMVGARQCYTYGAQSFVGKTDDDILPAGGGNDAARLLVRRNVIEVCTNGDPKATDAAKWFPFHSGAEAPRQTSDWAALGFDEFQDVVAKATFTPESGTRTYRQLDLFKYIMQART